ncbi:MAG: hypothetical protein KC613_14455 [Myxococcales bacterium]|nr:hypothetical protein [Myxococcales bacterium]MCB9525912.1 hypothetical protein [Myxococcales bacterium]
MSLPVTYARWLEELLGEAPPSEPKATCHDCVMCQPDLPADRAFNPATRCCTYVPRMPNFLVGRLLEDPDPALAPGLRSLQSRLAGEAAHPLGLELSEAQAAEYDRLLADESFGQADIQCPHQRDDGLCGIWKHRNGICATWFCRHGRGAVGEAFWDAVQRWLTAIEDVLAEFAARSAYQARGLAVDAAGLAEGAWGAWPGTPAEFYRACADRVAGLDWRAVRRLGGPAVRKRARAVRRTHRALFDERLPPRLWLAPHDSLDDASPQRRLMAYSGTDWVTVPAALDDLLGTFDGRRVPAAVAALRSAGCAPDGPLLRALYDQRVLVQNEP